MLLIIDVGLLIKYNALKNHVIVIVMDVHVVFCGDKDYVRKLFLFNFDKSVHVGLAVEYLL